MDRLEERKAKALEDVARELKQLNKRIAEANHQLREFIRTSLVVAVARNEILSEGRKINWLDFNEEGKTDESD